MFTITYFKLADNFIVAHKPVWLCLVIFNLFSLYRVGQCPQGLSFLVLAM